MATKAPFSVFNNVNTVGLVSKNADTCESLEMNNSLIIGNNDTDWGNKSFTY